MKIKEKFIGLVLIVLGIFPLIFKLKPFISIVSKYKFLENIMPGNQIYQLIIVVAGILLLGGKPKKEREHKK